MFISNFKKHLTTTNSIVKFNTMNVVFSFPPPPTEKSQTRESSRWYLVGDIVGELIFCLNIVAGAAPGRPRLSPTAPIVAENYHSASPRV